MFSSVKQTTPIKDRIDFKHKDELFPSNHEYHNVPSIEELF